MKIIKWIGLIKIFIEASNSSSSTISVAMSGDGQVVAVGDNWSSDGAGEASVYRRDGLNWNKIGQTITGDSSSHGYGFILKLNYQGDVLAASNNGNGNINVYKFTGDTWELKGSQYVVLME